MYEFENVLSFFTLISRKRNFHSLSLSLSLIYSCWAILGTSMNYLRGSRLYTGSICIRGTYFSFTHLADARNLFKLSVFSFTHLADARNLFKFSVFSFTHLADTRDGLSFQYLLDTRNLFALSVFSFTHLSDTWDLFKLSVFSFTHLPDTCDLLGFQYFPSHF